MKILFFLGVLLNCPAARYWLPPLAAAIRSWEPRNADHGVTQAILN